MTLKKGECESVKDASEIRGQPQDGNASECARPTHHQLLRLFGLVFVAYQLFELSLVD